MGRYILKRILATIPVLLCVTFVIFTLMHFTDGDPARLILGDTASEAEVLAMRSEMGLDKPFLEQYFRYLGGLLHGDLGISYMTKMPVSSEIMNRLPVTARLAFLSCLFAICVGVPAGIISAVRQYSLLDNVLTVLALLGITMPNFWLALMLILFFSVSLGILPASGLYGPLYYIMPIISISAASVATITRMTRSSMLEVIRSDYIRTARAKGLSEREVIFRHALKNALIPILTIVGIQFASGLSGAVVNEQVFAIPGIGKMMIDAIKNRNYPLVEGGVLVIAVMCCLVNLAVDLMYAVADPRIKMQYTKAKRKDTQDAGESEE
ncbi:MAG: ABC transporter permease [Sphaerochaetaceae bacterium]|nr:ABC transporter permease [Spirochaetales bacterium]MDY5500623.1 ABC transporter permease [Sphaerochaetaceae bacterium]